MKNIILIGMPGSGKSSLAKILAQNFSAQLIDTDLEIENLTGQSISKIFAKYGEKYFRRLETQILKKILPQKNLIIATGGGTPIYKNNAKLIRKLGDVIYLSCTAQTLLKNLSADYERPLVKNDLCQIKNLLAKRNLVYLCCCHFVLKCDGQNLNQIAQKLSVLRR